MQHNHPDAHFYDTLDKRFGVVGYMYRSLRAMYGDKLDAPRLLARRCVREIARWLRSVEAGLRMVLLEIARTLTLEPAPAHAPRANRVSVYTAPVATFALVPPPSRSGAHRAPAWTSMPDDDIDRDYRAASKLRRAAWNLEAGRCTHDRAVFRGFPPASGKPPPPLRARPKDLHNGGILRRFLGLTRVLEAPLRYAARLARRLARDPGCAERASRLPPYTDASPHFPDAVRALHDHARAPPEAPDDG